MKIALSVQSPETFARIPCHEGRPFRDGLWSGAAVVAASHRKGNGMNYGQTEKISAQDVDSPESSMETLNRRIAGSVNNILVLVDKVSNIADGFHGGTVKDDSKASGPQQVPAGAILRVSMTLDNLDRAIAMLEGQIRRIDTLV